MLCSKLSIKTLGNLNEFTLMFFLCCFSVFIVNLEQVNVCLDNCCTAKFFKTNLKSLAKTNTFVWKCLLKIKISTPTGSQNREF